MNDNSKVECKGVHKWMNSWRMNIKKFANIQRMNEKSSRKDVYSKDECKEVNERMNVKEFMIKWIIEGLM